MLVKLVITLSIARPNHQRKLNSSQIDLADWNSPAPWLTFEVPKTKDESVEETLPPNSFKSSPGAE